YRWLSKGFREVRKIRIAYIVKAIIAGLLIFLAICFGVTLYKNADVGAIFEWIIAFGFTFYLLTFFYDLRQAKGTRRGQYDKAQIRAGMGINAEEQPEMVESERRITEIS
ncbi:hypothetical protein H0H93_002276, partial [Arthromyces matolae]